MILSVGYLCLRLGIRKLISKKVVRGKITRP